MKPIFGTWISVKKSLPAIDTNALTMDICGKMRVLAFTKHMNKGRPKWFGDSFCTYAGAVTHWMPLPDMPEESFDDVVRDIDKNSGEATMRWMRRLAQRIRQ